MGSHSGPQAGVVLCHFRAHAKQHAKGGHHILLGNQAGKHRHGGLPVPKAQGREDNADGAADGGQDGAVVVLHHAKLAVHKTEAWRNHRMMEEARMMVPARLMKDQPRSQVARSTLTAAGTW